MAREQEIEFLGTIPLDAQVRIGGDSGDPIVVAHPESPAAVAFGEITPLVAARVSVLTIANQSAMIPIQMIG